MTSKRERPIFIVGFMATGKTTVGRIVAARLGWAMLDLDDEIARAAGISVPEIFASRGEAAFREEEALAVRAACARPRTVVATGGGAACREDSLAAMLAAGTVVALAATPEEAVRRAGAASGRPLLDGRADPVAAAAALLAKRRPFYARAHLQVDTTGKDPEAVASEILDVLDKLGRGVLADSMTSGGAAAADTVGVELGARRYDVRIGTFTPEAVADTLAAAFGPAAPTGVAVLVDRDVGARSPRVAPLVEALRARLTAQGAQGVQGAIVDRLDLPPGEESKTLAEIARTTEWLARRGFDRRAAVVGVGGGAATDHAGFAAAIYLRGVRFALVPTTLLGMVDASVGGKTAVDLPAGKNLVGAFHQPRAVVADLGFLDTLPRRELSAGLAEVVKCGFIADPQLLALLEGGAADRPETYQELVSRAVRVKAAVVAEDETEGGRRAILNFGHTVGHAIEAASGYGMLHGEAVALGMVAALSLGAARGITPPALVERARALLGALGLPTDVERRIAEARADILPRLGVDKKRRGGTIKFVFCPAPGETRLVEVTPDEIARHFDTPPREGAALDTFRPDRVQAGGHQGPMFRQHIQKLIDRLDGGIAGVLMGFDGIIVDSYAKTGFESALPEVQTLSMEFSHLVSQARRAVASLDAGALHEVSIRTDSIALIVHVLTEEYFLACAMMPTASAGKARYLIKVAAPQIRAEL